MDDPPFHCNKSTIYVLNTNYNYGVSIHNFYWNSIKSNKKWKKNSFIIPYFTIKFNIPHPPTFFYVISLFNENCFFFSIFFNLLKFNWNWNFSLKKYKKKKNMNISFEIKWWKIWIKIEKELFIGFE